MTWTSLRKLLLIIGLFRVRGIDFYRRFEGGADTGEGVISTAIVVLIIAFLAVGMWVAFKVIMGNATTSIGNQVSQLGQ